MLNGSLVERLWESLGGEERDPLAAFGLYQLSYMMVERTKGEKLQRSIQGLLGQSQRELLAGLHGPMHLP